MKQLVYKVVLLVVLSISIWLAGMQGVYSQSTSPLDSLRLILTHLESSTKDSTLQRAVREALILGTTLIIDSALPEKLLIIDSSLVNGAQVNDPMTLSYAIQLAQLFKDFPPEQGSPYYVTSLDKLAGLYYYKGQYIKALPLFEQVLAIRKKTLGEQHPDYTQTLNSLALLYVNMGKYDTAQTLLNQALAIQKNISGDHQSVYAESLDNLAVVYDAMGLYNKALPLMEQALAIRKKVLAEHDPDYAQSLNNLALLYVDMGKYDTALFLMEQVLNIRKQTLGDQHPDYAASLNNLAVLYNKMGQYDKALTLSGQALVLRKQILGDLHPDYATSLNSLANVYNKLGQYDTALSLIKQALNIRKQVLGDHHPSYATSLSSLAVVYVGMGQYDKAMPLFEQALAIRKKVLGDQHPDYAASLNNRAVVYFRIGQYDKALSLFEQVLTIRKQILGEQHPDYAASLNIQAVVYNQMGQYDKALPLFEQALAIRKKVVGEQHPDYAASLNNLAFFYSKMGQFDKAQPLFKQALAIRKKLGIQHSDYAQSLSNLAFLYYSMGQYDKALPLFKKALAIRKKALGDQHPDIASVLNNFGDVYNQMGQYNKALPLFEEAVAITKKLPGEQHPAYASSLHNLSTTYYNLEQYDKALPLMEKASAIRKNILGVQHPDYAESLNNLGKLYSSMGNPALASSLFSEASKITLQYLNQTYITLSEQEKMNFLKLKVSQFDYLPSLLFTWGTKQPALVKQIYANELALKGMILEDQKEVLNSIRKRGDSTVLQLYEQWQFNKAFIGKQILLPLSKRVPYFDSLQETTNQLEQELSRRAASFRNFQLSRHITANDISQKLLRGEAAVEFIRFHLFEKKWTDSIMYAALVLLPGDSTIHFVPLFEEKQLMRLLKPDLYANTTIAQYAAIEQLYGKSSGSTDVFLYQLLWKPLEPYLKGIHTIYYAPAGLLHRIAFEALPTDDLHRLIDTYQLRQVLSTRSIALPGSTTQNLTSVTLWGNINYNTQLPVPAEPSGGSSSSNIIASSMNVHISDTMRTRGDNGWGSLPGTKKELDSLAALFKRAAIQVSIDSGTAATEEAFKALSGRSPRLLHVATHSFFLPVKENKPKDNNAPVTEGGNTFTFQQNPMFRSGLLLAGGNLTWRGKEPAAGAEDGILTAYEIAQLDLSNTAMVVLSACETALGDVQGNEGVIGLQRAFRLAGVKELVMSLWRVPDEATMELMTLFYNNWLSGQSPQEALRTAQLKMKERYKPFYWAAFVVVE